MNTEKDEYILPPEQVELLQELYQVNMEHVFAVPFDYSLDLEAIKINAVLVVFGWACTWSYRNSYHWVMCILTEWLIKYIADRLPADNTRLVELYGAVFVLIINHYL